MDLFAENEPILRTEDLYQRPEPIPELRIRQLTGDVSSFEKRSSSSSSSGSSNGSSASQTSNLTPIVVGVVVPVVIIAIILFVVWRRRSKITKQEESHDKYKSLDFGVDPAGMRERKKHKTAKVGPEMIVTDLTGGVEKNRGISIDLGLANPYLPPPEVERSRESLISLSRSINPGDDKYRATAFVPDDRSIRSRRSSLRSAHDGSSIFSGSTKRFETESKTDLLPRGPSRETSEPPHFRKPVPPVEKSPGGLLAPKLQEHDRNSTFSTTSGTAAIRASNNYLGQYISGGGDRAEPNGDKQPAVIVTETEVKPSPPIEEPRQPPAVAVRNPLPRRTSSFYEQPPVADVADTDYHSKQVPTLPQIGTPLNDFDISTPSDSHSQIPHTDAKQDEVNDHVQSVSTLPAQTNTHHDDSDSDYYDEVYEDYEDVDYTYRGSMIGVRPLPPDDPTENPEQRANRIRSFYKEYFDDGSKSGARQTYYDGSEQYEDHVDSYYQQPLPRMPVPRPDSRQRAMSHGNHVYHGPPRAYSSMSGRMGPPRRGPPKKQLPPPKPLMLLPTPHKIKGDDFLPNAIDFAPPQVFKNQRSGTPDSLRGGLRPYSPSVRPHVPLTSSFDDLAAVPSP